MMKETEKVIIEYLRLYKDGEIEETFMMEQINTVMQEQKKRLLSIAL